MQNSLLSVLSKQKKEKDRLLAIPYIERTQTHIAKKWIDADLMKVVLGPRRAGKSVFSLSLLKDRPFAYCNFDDEGLFSDAPPNLDRLMQGLHATYGETKTILFDEIQNLPKWELFVNRLHRSGYNLVLTGSNAQLLSKELATALTGRHMPIEILPFDFQEFLRAKQHEASADVNVALLQQYLVTGGYPEVVLKQIDPHGYLDVLFDALLFTDVVRRHNVRFPEQIDMLGTAVINAASETYTLRRLANVLRFKSSMTLEKYLNYLIEAYLVFSVQQYAHKTGDRLRSPRKLYVVDNGFVSAKAVQHSPDYGKLMENLVFMELVKRGAQPNRDLFYYKTRNNREVDFLLKDGIVIRELIQVCYDVQSQDAAQREVKALVEAGEELQIRQLTVLTWDQQQEVRKGNYRVTFRPLWNWLTA